MYHKLFGLLLTDRGSEFAKPQLFVNSVSRESLGGKTPYEAFEFKHLSRSIYE